MWHKIRFAHLLLVCWQEFQMLRSVTTDDWWAKNVVLHTVPNLIGISASKIETVSTWADATSLYSMSGFYVHINKVQKPDICRFIGTKMTGSVCMPIFRLLLGQCIHKIIFLGQCGPLCLPVSIFAEQRVMPMIVTNITSMLIMNTKCNLLNMIITQE